MCPDKRHFVCRICHEAFLGIESYRTHLHDEHRVGPPWRPPGDDRGGRLNAEDADRAIAMILQIAEQELPGSTTGLRGPE